MSTQPQKYCLDANVLIQAWQKYYSPKLRAMYAANPAHQTLVDNARSRSLADPWVIAHAMKEKAIVVTKEEKITATNTAKIKIPNVCENVGSVG